MMLLWKSRVCILIKPYKVGKMMKKSLIDERKTYYFKKNRYILKKKTYILFAGIKNIHTFAATK